MDQNLIIKYSISNNDTEEEYTIQNICGEFVMQHRTCQFGKVFQTNEIVINRQEWEVIKKFSHNIFED